MYLEPELEEIFHEDSYGYRPGRSAIDAVGKARKRCWRYDWVVDLDIKGFFDSIDHELMMRAVRKHTEEKWVLLYLERWLTAPVVFEDGHREEREKGTPQGGVISPLLANLFLHYAFDEWMGEISDLPFERYADDIIIHCWTLKQAKWLMTRIEERLARCRLALNREKTKIVYCKDNKRTEDYPIQKFDFLGFTFRTRRAKNRKGEYFVNFLPAVSREAVKAMKQTLRDLGLKRRTQHSLEDLARVINPIVRGWHNYFGRFYRSALYPVLVHLDEKLGRWAMRKFKRFKKRFGNAMFWLHGIRMRQPELFAHWQFLGAMAG